MIEINTSLENVAKGTKQETKNYTCGEQCSVRV